MARMSPEATAAMWHDALVTKTKQRKIARHLFSWFGHLITAKEKDVDALAGKAYVECRYGDYSFLSRLGKKESDDDMKKRRRDITVRYWVSDPLLAAEDELITRLRGGQPILGFKFPLFYDLAIAMCFLAGHGNVAWRAGLTIIGSESDGQGEPVKLAHLLGKDLYSILENTVRPDLQKGFSLLQASSLLVVGSDKVKECLLVPRNAFINALALPIEGFFMEPPNGRGDENQKVLVDNASWDEIAQTRSLLFSRVDKSISGVAWQVSSRKVVTKEFREGKKIAFSADTTVELYPIVRFTPSPCIHLWGSPILHDEQGLVKDWLTRLEKFAAC
jgi:hypothetical protein